MEPHILAAVRALPNFVCLLPIAVAWLSPGGVVICYHHHHHHYHFNMKKNWLTKRNRAVRTYS